MSPSTKRTSDAGVYRLAALLVHDKNASRSCYAVAMAQGLSVHEYQRNALCQRYVTAMLGTDITSSLPWPDPSEAPINQRVRVLLLCFMAAMVEAGDA